MPKDISRMMVAVSDVTIGPDFNSRKRISNIDELASSIDEIGLVQPLVVREGGPSRTEPGKRKFFLVAGERRYHAVVKLGWRQVEIKLVKGNSQETALMNLVENAQRENLEPYEEAQAIQRIMTDYKLNQSQLAKKIGKSEPYVSQRLKLLTSTATEVKEAVEQGAVSSTHARELANLPKEEQKEVLSDLKEKEKARGGKKVTVAELKDEVDRRREKNKSEKDPDHARQLERVKEIRQTYAGVDLNMRSKRELLETLFVLKNRLDKPNISDATKTATKAQIHVMEYAFGVRETV